MLLLMLLLWLACATTDDSNAKLPGTTATDAVDMRLDPADFPEIPADMQVWWGAEVTIPPYSDKVFCTFGTYTGPDVGINEMWDVQDPTGHHFLLTGTTVSATDYPDGTTLDCTDPDTFPMVNRDPFVTPDKSFRAIDGQLELLGQAAEVPDDMAMLLKSGQRWVLEQHHINTTGDTVLAKGFAVYTTLAEDDVGTWAAPFILDNEDFALEPQSDATSTFDCSFDTDYTLTYLTGHMHEWGAAFKAVELEGDTEVTLHEVEVWDASYRDAAPVTNYEEGLFLPAGTVIRSTCNWHNDTDDLIEFPTEMCVTAGVAWPSKIPVMCSR